jgi:trehalose synthase
MSAARLDDYREVAPKGAIDLLLRLAERLKDRRFLHVNTGRYGGGSAEVLERLVPMMQELGVEAAWEVIVGDPEFYAGLRVLDGALAGVRVEAPQGALDALVETGAANARKLPLGADLTMGHDLGPVALARHRPERTVWLWRCHADLSRAQRRVWHPLRKEILRYDAAVFSLPKFAQRLGVPTLLVHPSIDPLSEKNRELGRAEIAEILDRLGIPRDRPIVLQVAPYLRSRDPAGVVHACRLAQKYVDFRLVLAGAGSADHPESAAVLAAVRELAGHDPRIHVLVLPPDAGREINALQRAATVVVHKAIQEDFALAVTEAMWKGKPVIGSLAGGIPAQVVQDVTGYTVSSIEGAAFRIRQLLQNPDLAARFGGAAREYVRRNFLVTRHLGDYLALLASRTG